MTGIRVGNILGSLGPLSSAPKIGPTWMDLDFLKRRLSVLVLYTWRACACQGQRGAGSTGGADARVGGHHHDQSLCRGANPRSGNSRTSHDPGLL